MTVALPWRSRRVRWTGYVYVFVACLDSSTISSRTLGLTLSHLMYGVRGTGYGVPPDQTPLTHHNPRILFVRLRREAFAAEGSHRRRCNSSRSRSVRRRRILWTKPNNSPRT